MNSAVLFVSPRIEDAVELAAMLACVPLELSHAAEVKQARERLLHFSYGAVLTEAKLPDGTWMDVLNAVTETAPYSALIVTKSTADDLFWAEVLNQGAYDLLAQPFDAGEVRRILSNACAQSIPASSPRLRLVV
jgi:two-component system response regulator PilR (NtrC family)